MFKNKKAWYTSNPKVGDQIFFKNAAGGICHTGLVYKVDAKTVYTVEGNTSNASGVVANGGGVALKSYPIGYVRIAGYGRPNYAGVTTKPATSTTTTATTKPAINAKSVITAKSFDKSVAGTYRVTASQLRLRTAPATGSTIMLMAKGTKVQCYGYYTTVNKTKWLLVRDGQIAGFCSKAYLQKT